jgi:hypothetical protein
MMEAQMPLNKQVKPGHSHQLQARNASDLHAFAQEGNLNAYLPLLTLIAEALDLAVQSEDIYLTIGTTMRNDALVCRIVWDGEKTPVYAETLIELADKANHVLEASEMAQDALTEQDTANHTNPDWKAAHSAPQRRTGQTTSR